MNNEEVLNECLNKLDNCRPSVVMSKRLLPELIENDLVPFRILSIYNGTCLAIKKGTIIAYLEFYKGGNIGIIAEDTNDRSTVYNEDVSEDELISKLKRVLK